MTNMPYSKDTVDALLMAHKAATPHFITYDQLKASRRRRHLIMKGRQAGKTAFMKQFQGQFQQASPPGPYVIGVDCAADEVELHDINTCTDPECNC